MEQETISGYIEHIIFRNEENGYTVMSVAQGGDEMTCVGSFPILHEGEYIEAEGMFTEHAVYGPQFQVKTYQIRVPDDMQAFERYIGSGAIKGIGEKLARRIISCFGSDTMRIMEEEPERLAEVKGISPRKAMLIGEQILEKSQMQNAMIFLAQYDIPLSLGVKIYQQYGDDLYRVLRENPYQLTEDLDGVGFRTADRIAARVGIRPDSEYRIRSGLLYVMSLAGREGHTYLPQEILLRETEKLLETDTDPERIRNCMMALCIGKKLITREEILQDGASERRVYAASVYFMELNTARMLKELNVVCESDSGRVSAGIARMEEQEEIRLDDIQKQAVYSAARNGLMILTGGPGTGKTTTINAMIRFFLAENMTISLAAPTGRAAKRMTETTGYEASTIHRLLEIEGGPEGQLQDMPRFVRNADNPLESDVIIIDEMSMVDIYLMHALLSAIVPGTRVILVGDVNQLPSVGPGSVLKDMIAGGACEVVRLSHIFRQAAQSDIVVNAHRIHEGKPVRLDNQSKDFFFLERQDVRVIQRAVLRLVQEKLPGYVHAQAADIQVLTPMRKGPLGVEQMNLILQRYLNPPSPDKEECESGGILYRTGDKVMQIRNNYQMEWEIRGLHGIAGDRGLGVFNGDIGTIAGIDPVDETVEVLFDENKVVTYTYGQLNELELAYAVTIHKSQGSEYPAVVIPLLTGPPMLMTRNLLYTAVTRAKSCVVTVGSGKMFMDMIANQMEENRYTSLDDRIREMREL